MEADEENVTCLICKEKVAMNSLESHLLDAHFHVGLSSFSCAKCGQTSDSRLAIIAHLHKDAHLPLSNLVQKSRWYVKKLINKITYDCVAFSRKKPDFSPSDSDEEDDEEEETPRNKKRKNETPAKNVAPAKVAKKMAPSPAVKSSSSSSSTSSSSDEETPATPSGVGGFPSKACRLCPGRVLVSTQPAQQIRHVLTSGHCGPAHRINCPQCQFSCRLPGHMETHAKQVHPARPFSVLLLNRGTVTKRIDECFNGKPRPPSSSSSSDSSDAAQPSASADRSGMDETDDGRPAKRKSVAAALTGHEDTQLEKQLGNLSSPQKQPTTPKRLEWVLCNTCTDTIANTEASRSGHVKKVHVTKRVSYFEAFRNAFPEDAKFGKACVRCRKDVLTECGQRSHVATFHLKADLSCPYCASFKDLTPSRIKTHIVEAHSEVRHRKGSFRPPAEWSLQLEAEVLRCFPVRAGPVAPTSADDDQQRQQREQEEREAAHKKEQAKREKAEKKRKEAEKAARKEARRDKVKEREDEQKTREENDDKDRRQQEQADRRQKLDSEKRRKEMENAEAAEELARQEREEKRRPPVKNHFSGDPPPLGSSTPRGDGDFPSRRPFIDYQRPPPLIPSLSMPARFPRLQRFSDPPKPMQAVSGFHRAPPNLGPRMPIPPSTERLQRPLLPSPPSDGPSPPKRTFQAKNSDMGRAQEENPGSPEDLEIVGEVENVASVDRSGDGGSSRVWDGGDNGPQRSRSLSRDEQRRRAKRDFSGDNCHECGAYMKRHVQNFGSVAFAEHVWSKHLVLQRAPRSCNYCTFRCFHGSQLAAHLKKMHSKSGGDRRHSSLDLGRLQSEFKADAGATFEEKLKAAFGLDWNAKSEMVMDSRKSKSN